MCGRQCAEDKVGTTKDATKESTKCGRQSAEDNVEKQCAARTSTSPSIPEPLLRHSIRMEPTDADLIAAVLKGDTASFEPLVKKYSPRLFATARRYTRRESEVEDIVQEIWTKAYHKLSSFRGEAPFEHWLMRMAVRTCYDALRSHQRNRETTFSELTEPENDWLQRVLQQPETAAENAEAARMLEERVLEQPSPPARAL